jgi:hypothetical protein
VSLPVGDYEVSGGLTGFQTTVRTGIQLTVGRTAVVDLSLRVGEVTQAVTVTGEAPLVETTTATVSQLVDEKRVAELPLNNRDLTQLAFLQPGVVKSPQTGDAGTGMGDKFTVAGARGTQHLFLLDGVSSGDASGNPQGASSAYIGAETVKEFQVITNNYSAEYKSQAGAIVSAVTKSGTNSLQGSLFGFHRNDNLDASKWETNRSGERKPEFKRNQFGGSLGGPIVRDRTFFFASYEGLRERLGTISLATVPTVEARQGVLGNSTVPVNSAMPPYLALWPIPGEGNSVLRNFGDGRVQIAGQGRRPTDDDFAAAKMDHHFGSEKLGFLSGTYNYQTGQREEHNVLGDVDTEGTGSTRHVISAGLTSILSPASVNQFNLGYSYADPVEHLVFTDRDWSSLKFLPHRELMGELTVGDITGIGHEYDPAHYLQKVLTLKDGLTITKSNHSFRLGGEVNFIRALPVITSNGYNGLYNFDNLSNFVQNVPQQFSGQLLSEFDGKRRIHQQSMGVYFQDNFTVLPSLTLNLGLRYEFTSVAKEMDGKQANLRSFFDNKTTVGQMYTNATPKSFSPRFGFAWAPGSRKTSLRGGFGIFYEHPGLYHYRTTFSQMPPFTTVGTLTAARAQAAGTRLVFPNAFDTQLALVAGTPIVWGMQYNQENATIYRWSLTAQREVASGWMVSAGYTGSRALHLLVQGVNNIYRWEGFPNQPSGPKFFPQVSAPNFINPAWDEVRIHHPAARSSYHGLSIGAQNRLTRGLQVQLAYTLSKATDDGSGIVGSDNFAQGQRTIFTWDWHLNDGPAAFDIRNNLVANFSYELPFGSTLSGIPAAIVKGWQFNGIITLSDGYPLTIMEARTAQRNRMGFTTGLMGNLKDGGNANPIEGTTAGCAGVAAPAGTELGGPDVYYDPCQFDLPPLGYFGTVGKGHLIAPGLATFDFSFFKNFDFAEQSRLQFRGEFFNLFNRPNFGAPDATPWLGNGNRDAAAGQVLSTRTSARQIQFGLKYIF